MPSKDIVDVDVIAEEPSSTSVSQNDHDLVVLYIQSRCHCNMCKQMHLIVVIHKSDSLKQSLMIGSEA